MKAVFLTIGVVAGLTLAGCNGDAPPPPFEACGAKTAKISGRLGLFRFRDKPLEFNESSTTEINVTVPSGATGTALDDVSTTGTQTPGNSGSRTFSATGMNTLYNVTVTGTVNADCTGSGNWRANKKSNGTQAGSGTWKID